MCIACYNFVSSIDLWGYLHEAVVQLPYMFPSLNKIFKYLVIQMHIGPLCDKKWLASMPNNDHGDIFMRAHGTSSVPAALKSCIH